MPSNQNFPRITIQNSRSKNLKLGCISLFISAMSVLALYISWHDIITGERSSLRNPHFAFAAASLGISIALLAIFSCFRAAFAKEPALEIALDGLTYRSALYGEGFLSWDAIDSFELIEHSALKGRFKVAYITAHLDPQIAKTDEFKRRQPRLLRFRSSGHAKKVLALPINLEGKMADILERLQKYQSVARSGRSETAEGAE